MNVYQLVALDMDGTLLDDASNVPEGNREAIKRAQQEGVHVVLSTGRFIDSTREYAASLGLTSFLVSSNGGEIWSHEGELLERHLLPSATVAFMRDLGRQHGVRYWGTATDGVFHWEEFPEDTDTYDWLKFGFSTEDDDKRQAVWESLKVTGELELTNSSPINIEVNPRGINKATALATVCRRLDLTMENVMAVGDSLNDIAMIKAAGCGVAMGNAQERVKEEADWITGTNVEEGVAQAIYRWVL